jgi:hypothetical protein
LPFESKKEKRQYKVANAVHVPMFIDFADPDAAIIAGHPQVPSNHVARSTLDYAVNLGPGRQHCGASVVAHDLRPVTSAGVRVEQEWRVNGATAGIGQVNSRLQADALLTIRGLARGHPAD